ncbi:MAG: beta-galactosidase [Acidobacteria bacterium]|nr:beta-galactosidase [Acidobacteriota bacterium]
MKRRQFLKSAAGVGAGLVAAMAVAEANKAEAAASTKGKPKRGVSVYSYSQTLGVCMTLEDCFADIHDMGATCFELLTSHIENYPNPSTKWIDHYWALCDKYKLQPAELGHWCETHLHRGPMMTDEQIIANMIRDFKLANMLGFHSLRTKITCINVYCDPEQGWERYIEKLLPYAEKYDVMMQSEVHSPTTLTRKHVLDYLEFADKHKTKHFGINADFGTFQNAWPDDIYSNNPMGMGMKDRFPNPSKPEDIIKILPYSRTCHAKFNYVDENFQERTIPYKQVLQIMVDQGWNGNLVSEYEGPRRDEPGFLGDQLRRQHIMMQRILGY